MGVKYTRRRQRKYGSYGQESSEEEEVLESTIARQKQGRALRTKSCGWEKKKLREKLRG